MNYKKLYSAEESKNVSNIYNYRKLFNSTI